MVRDTDRLTAGTISISDLTQLWRSAYGIEVGRFFSASEIQLRRVSPSGHYRFEPAIPGDADFYASLMKRLGYDEAEKSEFKEAALGIRPEDRVLDVGCGIGNFSVRCPGIYRGIDTNPAAIEDGRSLGRNVHLGSIENEPPDAYDVLVIFQVLEHVELPQAFLRSCLRSLRRGGHIIVSTPDMYGFMGYAANDILNYPPHHMTWWSDSSLQAMLESCGCEPRRVWHEPLRRGHLRPALSALLWPRGERHLNPSTRFKLYMLLIRVLTRIASPQWKDNIPFVRGHTVMVTATKATDCQGN